MYSSIHRVLTLALFIVALFLGGTLEAQTNIARGKRVTQSSNYASSSGLAKNAVDGNRNGNWNNGSVTATSGQGSKNPWITVDLGAVYDITKISLWNRTDCCKDRLDNFKILLKNGARESWRGFVPGTQRNNGANPLTYNGNSKGRYVMVQLINPSGILSLAEFEIYGTKSVAPTVWPTAGFYRGGNTLQKVARMSDGRGITFEEYDRQGGQRLRGPFQYLKTSEPNTFKRPESGSLFIVLNDNQMRYTRADGSHAQVYDRLPESSVKKDKPYSFSLTNTSMWTVSFRVKFGNSWTSWNTINTSSNPSPRKVSGAAGQQITSYEIQWKDLLTWRDLPGGTPIIPEHSDMNLTVGGNTVTGIQTEALSFTPSRIADILAAVKLGNDVSLYSSNERGINSLNENDEERAEGYISGSIEGGYSGNSSWANSTEERGEIIGFVVVETESTVYIALQGTEIKKQNALNNVCAWVPNPAFDNHRVPACYGLSAQLYYYVLLARTSSLKSKRVVITGHSQGGAIAAHLTYLLLKNKKLDPSLDHRLVTAMAPRYALSEMRSSFLNYQRRNAPKMTVDALEVNGDLVRDALFAIAGTTDILPFGERVPIPAIDDDVFDKHTNRESIYKYFED